VLVDDEVASSEWEQELYRMGVPPEMSVQFYTVTEAAAHLPDLQERVEPGIVLAGDIGTMGRLVQQAAGRIRAVNVGGVHHSPGRVQRLRFVFLTPAEEQGLRDIAAQGVDVSAQDVPTARPVPLGELLSATTGA
jgi:PTS system mannose-specific IIB component/fructoselysine and glucoselysine-specific PTS system IIB component